MEKHLKAISHTVHCSTPGYMQAGRPNRKAKNAATPLCYVDGIDGKPLGHVWENTTSSHVKKCNRCHLIQYLSDKGHWKNARSLKDARKSIKNAVEQASMWDTLEKLEAQEG